MKVYLKFAISLVIPMVVLTGCGGGTGSGSSNGAGKVMPRRRLA